MGNQIILLWTESRQKSLLTRSTEESAISAPYSCRLFAISAPRLSEAISIRAPEEELVFLRSRAKEHCRIFLDVFRERATILHDSVRQEDLLRRNHLRLDERHLRFDPILHDAPCSTH